MEKELKAKKASGIDNMTKWKYEANIDANIEDLLKRMKALKYRPKPVKRVYIPKAGSTKKRPLGIPSYEDKIVQLAINKILQAIYEQDYLDSSFGFRPNRSCHDAKAFYEALKKRLAKFNLEIAEDKTKIINFGKKAYYDHKFGRT